MLRYVVTELSERTQHPLLVGLFLLAGLFLLGGVIVDQVTGNAVATGFFGVYATMAVALGALGFLAVFTSKIAMRVRREYGPS